MGLKLKETIEYRFDTEEEVKEFLEKVKEEEETKGYTRGPYSSAPKVKKAKGEVVDSGFLVKVTKIYNDFWDDAAY